ncbi:MAG TPA: hypothetical protein VKX17_03980 [Planctomycetota bacterium]|nr:hypothetical protein [Planctomycetota bacterium]
MLLLLVMPGCGAGTTQDIARKAEKAKTKEELEAALGKPDKFEKHQLGGASGEQWTYKASDGEVKFVIVNGKVIIENAKQKSEQK